MGRERVLVFFISLLSLLVIDCDVSRNEDILAYYLDKSNSEAITIPQRIYYIKKASFEVQKIADDSLRLCKSINVSNRYWNIGKLKEFAEINNRVIDEYSEKELTFPSIFGKASLNIADYYYATNNDSAYLWYKEAEAIYSKTKDQKQLSKCIVGKGQLQYEFGEYFLAERSAYRVLKDCSNCSGCDDNIYRAYNLLGNIYMDLKDYELALKFHHKALNDFEKGTFDDPFFYKEVTYFNIGLVNQKMNKNNLAIIWFKSVLKNEQLKKENLSLYANAIDALAYSELIENGYTNQNKFFEASEINKKLGISDRFTINTIHLSEYYLRCGDTIEASLQIKKGLGEVWKLKSVFVKLELLEHLKRFYLNQNYFNSLIVEIVNEIKDNSLKKRDKFARIEFETEKVLGEKKDAEQHRLLVIIFSSVVIVLMILLLIIKNQKVKQSDLYWKHLQSLSDEKLYRLIIENNQKVENAKIDEKNRISRELHDGVMNKLTSTRLNLFALCNNPDIHAITRCVKYISQIQEIEQDIRKISHDLSDHRFNENNFDAVLEDLLASQDKSQIKFSFIQNKEIRWDLIEPEDKMNIFRVIQELLQNSISYSFCKNFSITLFSDDDGLIIRVYDDGIGMKQGSVKKGLGLANITFRVKQMGGKLEIRSQKSKGMEVSFSVPYK